MTCIKIIVYIVIFIISFEISFEFRVIFVKISNDINDIETLLYILSLYHFIVIIYFITLSFQSHVFFFEIEE